MGGGVLVSDDELLDVILPPIDLVMRKRKCVRCKKPLQDSPGYHFTVMRDDLKVFDLTVQLIKAYAAQESE